VQFLHSVTCKETWPQYLQSRGLPGECIVVEITEGLLLDTSNAVAETLLGMRDAGIQVSLDDFGTGYSSLSYLQRFDIDFIKIDQSFVRHLIPDSTDLALCKAIIVMAHALGMQVIAEGVETVQQRDLLAAAGCDYAQGYLYARPMPASDFEHFMAAS
jgi:EAL domain-containing protein (putative c-di-GMP-specific phosphodiesterase class I)